VVFTFGILLLVLYWKPELDCYMKRKECPLYSADVILVMVRFFNQSEITAQNLHQGTDTAFGCESAAIAN